MPDARIGSRGRRQRTSEQFGPQTSNVEEKKMDDAIQAADEPWKVVAQDRDAW